MVKAARARLEQLIEVKAAKRRLDVLEAELERKKREESIRYYTPHLQQQAFHYDDAQLRMVLGGNRSGKTQAGVSEDVAHSLGFRPWLPKGHPHRKVDVRVPNKGLVIGESFGEQVAKVLVPKFLGDPERGIPGVIPKALIQSTKKNQQGVITMIRLTNGSSITFQSYDQAVELFEGADYDWIHLDEPPPRAVWIAVARGLIDHNGRAWFTMTPLKEPWIYDELVAKDYVAKYYFDMMDNVGFGLTIEAVNKYIANLTPDEIEARVHGRFFHLTGLVYKAYGAIHRVDRAKVFRESAGKVPPSWNLWMHIDPHPRTPHHAIWVAIAPNNIAYVVGEQKCTHPTNHVPAFAQQIFTYEREILGASAHIERIIDASSQINDPLSGGSTYETFDNLGLRCRIGSKDRDSGVLFLQSRLNHDPESGLFPTIFFMDDLQGIHFELTHYVWDDWTKKTGQIRTEKQVPRDKDDHFIEGLHRILLAMPEYEAPSESGPEDPGGSGPVGGAGQMSFGY